MGNLREIVNIGKVMEKRLAAVGIYSFEALKQVGSKEAFTRLYLHEGDTCLSSLCGLEGAIQGVRWHYLDKETKENLKKFFDSFKKNEL